MRRPRSDNKCREFFWLAQSFVPVVLSIWRNRAVKRRKEERSDAPKKKERNEKEIARLEKELKRANAEFAGIKMKTAFIALLTNLTMLVHMNTK